MAGPRKSSDKPPVTDSMGVAPPAVVNGAESRPVSDKPAPDKTKARLSFAVVPGADLPDTAGMHESTKEALTRLVKNPRTAEVLGIQPAGPVADASMVAGELAAHLANLVMMGEALFLQRQGISGETIREVARLTPEETKLITDPAGRLIDRHGAKYLAQYGDWVSLSFALLNVTTAKLALAKALDAQKKAAVPVSRPIDPNAPTTVDVGGLHVDPGIVQ